MYNAPPGRYEKMIYNRCGKSGVKLPSVSLGLWQNFGEKASSGNMTEMLRTAFDNGITHFDLANNYGPPAGAAEENFGIALKKDFMPYRGEMIISTKAGYYMWPGPYGDGGSRKYLISSLDASLLRTGLDYVDIFYSHRPDPETPLEETMTALADIVKQGKALYAGLSNYNAELTAQAADILSSLGVKCLIHQPVYNMLNRWVEGGLLDVLAEKGMGCIPFSPLAGGLLTGRYLSSIPEGSRASSASQLKDRLTPEFIEKLKKLNDIAGKRGQSLAQMSLAWLLRDGRVTSVLFGASSGAQILDNLKTIENISFSQEELAKIDEILN